MIYEKKTLRKSIAKYQLQNTDLLLLLFFWSENYKAGKTTFSVKKNTHTQLEEEEN